MYEIQLSIVSSNLVNSVELNGTYLMDKKLSNIMEKYYATKDTCYSFRQQIKNVECLDQTDKK